MLIHRIGDDARDRKLYGGSGTLGLEYYFRAKTALPVTVMRFHLEPGTSEGEHLHLGGHPDSCSPDDSDELYVVTAGEVVMTVDGDRALLRTGEALYAPAGSTHGVANESTQPAELILVFGTPQTTMAPLREP